MCNTKDGIKNMLLIELYSFLVIQDIIGIKRGFVGALSEIATFVLVG